MKMNHLNRRSPLFLVLKVIALQSFFVLTSKFGPLGYETILFFIAIVLMLVNYILIRSMMKFKYYIFLMFFFFASGFIQDTILIHLGILKLNTTFPPIWFATLWLIFLGYYGDVFNKMLSFPFWLSAILGAIGGSLAYYRGISMMEVETHPYFYQIIAIIWAFFMPMSLRLFSYFKTKSTAHL